MGCQLISCINGLKEKGCLFTPVSEKNARASYSASLTSVTVAGGGIRCDIDAPGGLTYIGVGGGWGLGISWGTATLSKSYHELRRLGNNTKKDHSKGWIGGWEFIPVIFYFRFNAPYLTMNSGGFGGLGYAGGSGYYVAQYL